MRFSASEGFALPLPRWLAWAFWGVYLLFCLLFYQERTLFLDGAFQLFHLVNEQAVQVYHYRFVTALPQLLPYLAVKLQSPLSGVMLLYSLSYGLFFLSVFWMVFQRWKNEALGWTLIFYLALLGLDTFYHIQSEYYLGIALLVLVFALVLRHPDLPWRVFPLLGLLLVTIAFAHKLTFVFFLFLWGYFGLQFSTLRHRRYLVLLLFMGAIVVVKSVFFTNWYEVMKQEDFNRHLEAYWPHLHTLPAHRLFLKRLLHHYGLWALFLGLVSVFYLYRRRILKLVWVWGTAVGYLLLYHVADPMSPYRFYAEVSYLPLALLVAVPLFFEVLPQYGVRWWGWVLAGVLVWRLWAIGANHQTFERRTQWALQQLSSLPPDEYCGLVLPKEGTPTDTLIMEWGLPFSTLLKTSLLHPDSARSLLVTDNWQRFQKHRQDSLHLLTPFKPIPKADLNPSYFRMPRRPYFFSQLPPSH